MIQDRFYRYLLLGIGLIGWFATVPDAIAQIVPDNTLPTNSSVAPGCTTCTINGGTQRGVNLFHSFDRFSVPTGGSAYFNNAPAIQNILTRVTGNLGSTIDGLLRANGTANLFLMNPNGIIFGSNASLNVGGSFVATTANAMQFGDQGFFSATNPAPPSSLLTINPSAFVFNQLNQGAILVRSQAPAGLNPYGSPTNGLRVPDGQSLLLVGGDVTLDGGRIRAYGGRVELAGLAAPGRIDLLGGSSPDDQSALRLQVPTDAIRADVSLTNATITSFNTTGGDIGLYGSTLSVSNSNLFGGLSPGTVAGVAQAGDIILNATYSIVWGMGSTIDANVDEGAIGNGGKVILWAGNRVLLDGQPNANGVGGVITAQLRPGSVGQTGTIQVTTGSLELLNGALLSTSSLGKGAPGSIVINARDHVVLTGTDRNGFSSSISSVINGGTSRDAPGNIQITTGSLRLAEGAQIVAGNTDGQGQGGAIQIQARGAVEIAPRSIISSQVRSRAVGDGGAISIEAGSLSLLSGGQITSTVDFAATGNAGEITINAGSLFLKQATISSAIFGQGNAGTLTIQVADGIRLSDESRISTGVLTPSKLMTAVGNSGDMRIQARTLVLTDDSAITSQNDGAGNAGKQWITVDTLRLNNSSIIASARKGGQAGTIQIEARDGVTLEDRKANIQSALFDGRGRGGQIIINTGNLSLINALGIVAPTLANGTGGDITLNVGDRLLVDNSLIFSTVARNGQASRGGNIDIRTGSLVLRNGGIINAATYGQGDAGDITIDSRNGITLAGASPSEISVESTSTGATGNIFVNSPRLTIDDKSRINANSNSVTGGNITLNLGELLLLRRGGSISTNAGTAQQGGNGGNITINAPNGFIVGVLKENSDISANAFTGSGGKVNITAQGIYGLRFQPRLTPFSDITASSTLGVSGVVAINQLGLDPSGGLVQLPTGLVDPSNQIDQRCVPKEAGLSSSFTITGTGGIAASPMEPLMPQAAVMALVPLPEEPDNGVQAKEPDQQPVTSAPSVHPAATPIVEAQGWTVDRDGKVHLVADARVGMAQSPAIVHPDCQLR
jgi:filamentous hemagglutinin family protein